MTLIAAAPPIWMLCATPTAADDAFADACKLAAASDIAAPITPQDKIDIRSMSAYPRPGEATWSGQLLKEV